MAGDCAVVNVSRARHTGITYRSGEISDILRERPGLDEESVKDVGGKDEGERGGEVVQHVGESRPSRRVACGPAASPVTCGIFRGIVVDMVIPRFY